MTIIEKIQSASRFTVLSAVAIAFAANISIAHANGIVGIGPEGEPGNSEAALTGRQAECLGQKISDVASTTQGIGAPADAPTSVVETVDILFYAGKLLPNGFDCAQLPTL